MIILIDKIFKCSLTKKLIFEISELRSQDEETCGLKFPQTSKLFLWLKGWGGKTEKGKPFTYIIRKKNKK